MHLLRNARDLREVPDDVLVAVDVLLEDLPVVDARLPRRAGVEQHEALVHFLGRNCDGLAMNSIGIEVNGVYPAVHRRIVVLATGGNANQLRFDILCDHANLFDVDVATHKTGQRSAGANHHGGRTRDAGAGG